MIDEKEEKEKEREREIKFIKKGIDFVN